MDLNHQMMMMMMMMMIMMMMMMLFSWSDKRRVAGLEAHEIFLAERNKIEKSTFLCQEDLKGKVVFAKNLIQIGVSVFEQK